MPKFRAVSGLVKEYKSETQSAVEKLLPIRSVL